MLIRCPRADGKHMGIQIRAVPVSGHIFTYEQYRTSGREERAAHSFASYCYRIYEQVEAQMPELPSELSYRYSYESNSSAWAYPSAKDRKAEWEARESAFVGETLGPVRDYLSDAELRAAEAILDYLGKTGGVIDSWPQRKIKVPLAAGRYTDSSGWYDYDDLRLQAALQERMDEIYFHFTFPEKKLCPESRLTRQVNEASEEIKQEKSWNWTWLPVWLAANCLLPALLALNTYLRGPEFMTYLLDEPGLQGILTQLPSFLIPPAVLIALVFFVPALILSGIFAVGYSYAPVFARVFAGLCGALFIFFVIQAFRTQKARRKTILKKQEDIETYRSDRTLLAKDAERGEKLDLIRQLNNAWRVQ